MAIASAANVAGHSLFNFADIHTNGLILRSAPIAIRRDVAPMKYPACKLHVLQLAHPESVDEKENNFQEIQ